MITSNTTAAHYMGLGSFAGVVDWKKMNPAFESDAWRGWCDCAASKWPNAGERGSHAAQCKKWYFPNTSAPWDGPNLMNGFSSGRKVRGLPEEFGGDCPPGDDVDAFARFVGNVGQVVSAGGQVVGGIGQAFQQPPPVVGPVNPGVGGGAGGQGAVAWGAGGAPGGVPAGGGWVGGAPGGSNTTLILGAGALGLAALVLLTRRK